MAEEDKGTSSWYKVPTWSGDPSEWRSFKREMEWWLASLDPESCKKYNVAARWALRQSGVVRARCEEFDPADLKGTTEVRRADPDTGAEVVAEEADPFSGIRKLLSALEASMGRTEMDRKAELRKQFYQTIRRSAGERISTFCTRYRTLIGEMRREGITLPAGELGWFLKDRLGLDALRIQLLDTALQGKEDYEEVEREVLRLFRDLHVSDPLYKSKPVGGNDNKSYPLQRFLQSSNQHGLRSGAPSSAGSSVKSFKTSSSYRFGRPSSSASSGRQAYVVEDATEVEPEGDEELIPDDGDGNANGPNLEEVLQCEAEVLAAEIQELEESGEFDTAVLEELEAGVEQAAESLVTMREARSRINEIKRDRGFGRAPAGSKPKLNGNQVEKKKTKTQCWDCGEFGHWGGDPQCPKPGAGLHKPKHAGKRPAVQKHVKVVESLNTEHVLDEPPVSNEINMVHHDSMRFEEALESSKQEDKPVPGLSRDKVLMGALDSACNRTCAGEVWIQHFLLTLQHAPPEVQAIVATAEENELFRFGNGGTQRSSVRYRLPVMVGNNLLAVWVSVVKVPSLGLLLGRDFLDGIGAVISFTKQKLRPDFLDGKLISLSQVAAGHFALSLVPSTWPRLGGLRWRRCGPDGILEQQITSQAWLSRKLNMSKQFEKHGGSHEHLVTEQGFNAAHLAVLTFPLPGPSVQAMSLKTQPPRPTTSPTSSEVGVPTSTSPVTSPTTSHGPSTKGQSKLRKPMVSNGTPAGHSRSMARIWAALMACAAACNQILAVPLSGNNQSGAVGATNQGHGAGQVLGEETWRKGPDHGLVYGQESPRMQRFPQSSGLEVGILGKPPVGWHARSPLHEGPSCKASQGDVARGQGRGRQVGSSWNERASHATADRAEGRSAHPQRRLAQAGRSPQLGLERPDEGRADQRGHQANVGNFERRRNLQQLIRRCGRKSESGCEERSQTKDAKCATSTSSCGSSCRTFSLLRKHDSRNPSNVGTARAAIPVHDESDDATHGVLAASASSCGPEGFHRRGDARDQCRLCGPAGGGATLGSAWRRDGMDDTGRESRCGGSSFLSPPNGLQGAGDDGLRDTAPVSRPLRLGLSGAGVDGFRIPKESKPLGLSEARADGLRMPDEPSTSEWRLEADRIKTGQAQQIAQAWQKHKRDQELISKGDVHAVMQAEWMGEMESCLNECFVSSLVLAPGLRPPPEPDGVFVSEVFTTVQRIIKEAANKGHSVGSAMSLETGWNFLKAADRKAAKEVVMKEKPYLLALAFPCGPWSALMRLNPSKDLALRRAEGRVLIKFAIELAELQPQHGRHFLLENPLTAESWSLAELKRFLRRLECHQAVFDQCRFKLRGPSGLLHKKPTKVVTSSEKIADRLDGKRCNKDHEHEHVMGGSRVTAAAGLYTKELAREIIKGLEEEFEKTYGCGFIHETLAVDGAETDGDLEEALDREVDPPMEFRDIDESDDEAQVLPTSKHESFSGGQRSREEASLQHWPSLQ